MVLSIFDFIGWLIETAGKLLGALLQAVMSVLSAVSRVIFTPLTWGADRVFDALCLTGPWAFLIVLGGAALTLVLLAVVGWIILSFSRKKGK